MSYLEVTELTVTFGRRAHKAVDSISFTVEDDERFGIIGQSGSGKSVTALAIMGLLPEHAHVTGSIKFNGRELVGLPERDYRALRGDDLAMIFQEPMTALDPTMKVGRQIGEVVALHHGEHRGNIRGFVHDWLGRVGIGEPERIADSYPHELSGGQRQRALIAMALADHQGSCCATSRRPRSMCSSNVRSSRCSPSNCQVGLPSLCLTTWPSCGRCAAG